MSDAKFKPVILVCGKTGIGKTSLIQAVTGREIVPDSAIGTGMPVTHGFTPYETEAATFVDAEGMEPGTTVADYIAFLKGELLERLATGKSENVITNVWYCVDGPGARVQDADREIVKAFGEKVILVVTKSEIMRKSQFETMNAAVSSLVPESRIVMVSSETKSGLDQLISRTKAMITSATGSEELAEFERRSNCMDLNELLKNVATAPQLLHSVKDILNEEISLPNIPTPTLGGKVFWNTLAEYNGWRLQQNMITQHCRIIDQDNVRRAWGTKNGMIKALETVKANREKFS